MDRVRAPGALAYRCVAVLALAIRTGAAGAAPVAAAGTPPLASPRHDVSIVYRVLGVDATQRLSVSIPLHRQRVDAPGGTLSVITDQRAGRMLVLDLVRHTYADLPAPARVSGPLGNPDGFVKVGAASMAGVACTEWRTTDASGNAIELCLDDDGDTLSLAAGGRTLIRAVSVSRQTQDPARFSPPPGFRPSTAASARR